MATTPAAECSAPVTLRPLERRAARALLGTLFPSIPGGLPGADGIDLIPTFEQLLARMPRLHAVGIRAAFTAVAIGLPALMLARPRPLWTLDQDAREASLERLVKHPIYLVRQLGLLVKAIGSLVYFQDPRVRAALALPPAKDPLGHAQGLLS